MNAEDVLKILDSITKLLGILIWPAETVFVLVRFGSAIREFIAHIAESRSKARELKHPAGFSRLRRPRHLRPHLFQTLILMLRLKRPQGARARPQRWLRISSLRA